MYLNNIEFYYVYNVKKPNLQLQYYTEVAF